MASPDILELARQGDPQVLEALINHSLKTHGVSTRVRRQGNFLYLLVEAPRLLSSARMSEALCKLFQNLGLHRDLALKVYHRQAGERAIAWEQDLDLAPLSSQVHIPAKPEVQPPEYSNPENQTEERSSVTTQELPNSNNATATSPSNLEAPSTHDPATAEMLFANDDTNEITSNLLRRPESVVLLLFVSIVLLWEFYLDLIDEGNTDGPLSGRGLARRLGVNSSTISRRKERADFESWTQDLDPDGIAWRYEDGLFMPVWAES